MRKITEKRPRLQPIDLSKLKTYPLGRRHSKVQVSDFSVAWRRGGSLRLFLQTLPDILAVKALYELRRTGGRYALTTMCIGGGQGIAAIFERI